MSFTKKFNSQMKLWSLFLNGEMIAIEPTEKALDLHIKSELIDNYVCLEFRNNKNNKLYKVIDAVQDLNTKVWNLEFFKLENSNLDLTLSVDEFNQEFTYEGN